MTLAIYSSWSCKNGKTKYKKAWCPCKVVALLIKPNWFLDILVLVALLNLKVPNERCIETLIKTQTHVNPRLRNNHVTMNGCGSSFIWPERLPYMTVLRHTHQYKCYSDFNCNLDTQYLWSFMIISLLKA